MVGSPRLMIKNPLLNRHNHVLTNLESVWFFPGFEAKQYCRPFRLHLEDPRLRVGQVSRNLLHDDPLRRDPLLPCARSHPRHGVQGER